MNIVIDLMGGDGGPKVVYDGAKLFFEEKQKDIKLIFVGDKLKLGNERVLEIKENENFELIHTEKFISMNDKPTKRDEETSIAIAANLVKSGKGDALYSTGHTGAIMGQAMIKFGRIKNVHRPCIAAKMPHQKGFFLLVDAGANADSNVDTIVQFAVMGSIYAEKVLGKKDPKVGLLNIGKEEKKGSKLYLEVHSVLKQLENINFIGNIEGQDIYSGNVDVVVCDGFTGNIFLKASEGIAKFILNFVGKTINDNIEDKMLVQSILGKLTKLFDPSEYGGGVLVGLKKVCVKGHGGSDEKAVKSSLNIAYTALENRLNEVIESVLE